MRLLSLAFVAFCFVGILSCKKEQDLSAYRISTKADFANFLATKPFDKIDSTSYNFGKDDVIFQLFEETGRYTWDGQDWHRENIFPLWIKYKKDHNLLSEKEYAKAHFKNFLATKPFPGVDESSYSNGEDDFYLNLFEETGIFSWYGQEWHRDNVLPLWKKYKLDKGLKITRAATQKDFANFLATKPVNLIDSASYRGGQDEWWFILFQENDPVKWKGQEWHRDNVLPKWNEYKLQNNLR